MAREEIAELARNSDISIGQLIAAPLKAAADAQLDLAKSTVEFIQTVGLEQDEAGMDKVRNLHFNLSAMGKDGAEKNLQIQAPLLAIVPIPNLAVEEVDIGFQMEVTSARKDSGDSSEVEGQGVQICGQVSSQAANTRATNQSAKYQIQVKARKQENPEGLSRILDLMAQAVQGL